MENIIVLIIGTIFLIVGSNCRHARKQYLNAKFEKTTGVIKKIYFSGISPDSSPATDIEINVHGQLITASHSYWNLDVANFQVGDVVNVIYYTLKNGSIHGYIDAEDIKPIVPNRKFLEYLFLFIGGFICFFGICGLLISL